MWGYANNFLNLKRYRKKIFIIFVSIREGYNVKNVKKGKSLDIEYSIVGEMDENCILRGIAEKTYIELGNSLKPKIKLQVVKIDKESANLKILDFCFAGIRSLDGKPIETIVEEQVEEREVDGKKISTFLKNYEFTLKVNEKVSLYGIVSTAPTIHIKLVKTIDNSDLTK